MPYLDKYLEKIAGAGNRELADSVSRTAEEVGTKYLSNFSFISHEIGLLFGNVQSGKTGQMFGIICKAADLGFPAFVLLTTDNIVLQQQTLDRVRNDLDGFCICGENDAAIFAENSLMEPVVIVLKKNSRILKLWANILNSTGFMRGNPLFIIDDEADAASLNTLVNRNRKSSVNKYIDTIRNGASSSLYLQVTGTPQAIFLQTIASGWHPLFTYYFKPGKNYIGGDFFFPKTGKPDCVTYVDRLPHPEHEAVVRHLLVSAQIFASGGGVSTCLIHPSVRQSAHESAAESIKAELLWCKSHLKTEFADEIAKLYPSLRPSRTAKASLDEIQRAAAQIVENDEAKIIIMNGKTDVQSDQYVSGCCFVIGGNTLGRGVTFPGLQTLYYTRTAKKPQADTMWQHSRMFGYDRDPGLMMVYIDEQLYKLFADISATNNSIIAQVEQGLDNVKIYYPEGLNPTRKNVLDTDHVSAISGGTNYYPLSPDNDTIADITALLERFSENEKYYQVSLRLMRELLTHVVSSPDFRLPSFIAILDMMLSEEPAAQGILIVRRNRDVAQGTGALLSADDWKLGGNFTDRTVLTMYQVTGNKGWGGKNLWVPNIKLPQGAVYYDVE